MRDRRVIAVALAIAGHVISAGAQVPAATCELPLTEQDVRDYLGIRGLTILRQRIPSCGVTFITDADVEHRLREAGADDGLISLLSPSPRSPAAGQKWTPPTDKREMVWVPRGVAHLGSPPSEADREADEAPHVVELDRGFWLDATEVTKQAFRQFVIAVPQWQKARINRSLHDGAYLAEWNGNDFPSGEGDRPVVNVSWHAAVAYAAWAGKRLPTEAEWEYAARAGTGTAFWWGETFDRARAHGGLVAVQAVGGAQTRNAWGLADMLGNVWEWTGSLSRPYPYLRTDGREDSAAPGPRAVRGGSASNGEKFLRAAKRHKLDPTVTNDMVGFRCAR